MCLFQGHIKSNCYSFCGYTLIYLAFNFVVKLFFFFFSCGKNTCMWLKMVKINFFVFPNSPSLLFVFVN